MLLERAPVERIARVVPRLGNEDGLISVSYSQRYPGLGRRKGSYMTICSKFRPRPVAWDGGETVQIDHHAAITRSLMACFQGPFNFHGATRIDFES